MLIGHLHHCRCILCLCLRMSRLAPSALLSCYTVKPETKRDLGRPPPDRWTRESLFNLSGPAGPAGPVECGTNGTCSLSDAWTGGVIATLPVYLESTSGVAKLNLAPRHSSFVTRYGARMKSRRGPNASLSDARPSKPKSI